MPIFQNATQMELLFTIRYFFNAISDVICKNSLSYIVKKSVANLSLVHASNNQSFKPEIMPILLFIITSSPQFPQHFFF